MSFSVEIFAKLQRKPSMLGYSFYSWTFSSPDCSVSSKWQFCPNWSGQNFIIILDSSLLIFHIQSSSVSYGLSLYKYPRPLFLPLAWLLPWSWPVSPACIQCPGAASVCALASFLVSLNSALKHSQSDPHTKSRNAVGKHHQRLCSISPLVDLHVIQEEIRCCMARTLFSLALFVSHITSLSINLSPIQFHSHSSLAVSLASAISNLIFLPHRLLPLLGMHLP